MITDSTRQDSRGTALGRFSLDGGVATLPASIIAGWLWEGFDAPTIIIAGASIVIVALIGFIVLKRPSRMLVEERIWENYRSYRKKWISLPLTYLI
jgi:hypothetical protein